MATMRDIMRLSGIEDRGNISEMFAVKGSNASAKGMESILRDEIQFVTSPRGNIYLVLEVKESGRIYRVSGSMLRLCNWLVDLVKVSGIDKMRVIAVTGDRNESRKMATEV